MVRDQRSEIRGRKRRTTLIDTNAKGRRLFVFILVIRGAPSKFAVRNSQSPPPPYSSSTGLLGGTEARIKAIISLACWRNNSIVLRPELLGQVLAQVVECSESRVKLRGFIIQKSKVM